MHRKFISFILGAAIAVTSVTASTAQAGSNNRQRYAPVPQYAPQNRQMQGNEAIAAALAGAAALFIIGKTIQNNNSQARPRAHHAPRAHRGHHGHRRAHGHHRGHGHWKRHHRHGGRHHRH